MNFHDIYENKVSLNTFIHGSEILPLVGLENKHFEIGFLDIWLMLASQIMCVGVFVCVCARVHVRERPTNNKKKNVDQPSIKSNRTQNRNK